MQLLERMPEIGIKVSHFLGSGSAGARSGRCIPQISGLVVGVEWRNFFRYWSGFRSVHRGVYFSRFGGVSLRRLLPEAWGFLCPVHTPDGSLCGILGHLSMDCKVSFSCRFHSFCRRRGGQVLLGQGALFCLREDLVDCGSYGEVYFLGGINGLMHLSRVGHAVAELDSQRVVRDVSKDRRGLGFVRGCEVCF